MAILNILEFPDSRLRTIAKPVAVVDDKVRQLVDDMFETMYEAPGIGLAATQVNVHLRVVVMDLSEDRSEPRVYINPEFEPLTDEMGEYQEGCLSVPEFYENVERPLRVKISARHLPGNRVAIEVADNGRGIADTDHERVFELFRRSGQQDQSGEGIGLAHVRSLARNLGGEITVRSQFGEGSTFVLRLPSDLSRLVRS